MISEVGLSPSARAALERIRSLAETSKASLYVHDPSGVLLDHSPSPLPSVIGHVTQLYTLAMVLREFDRGAMEPSSRLVDLLPNELVEGLCVVNGADLSDTITLEHLLSHQSGIPDFFEPRGTATRSLEQQIRTSDRGWKLEQALEIARHYPGHFRPGTPGKAHYSLTNYMLIGAVLTQSTGMSLEQLIQLRVVVPLGLKNTSVFTPSHYDSYFSIIPVREDGSPRRTPRALASFDAAGSIITTAKELAAFAGSMWSGAIFDPRWLEYLPQDPRSLGGGIKMARGVFVLKSPRRQPAILAHASPTGSAVVVDPETQRVAALCLNQTSKPGETIRLAHSLLTGTPSLT